MKWRIQLAGKSQHLSSHASNQNQETERGSQRAIDQCFHGKRTEPNDNQVLPTLSGAWVANTSTAGFFSRQATAPDHPATEEGIKQKTMERVPDDDRVLQRAYDTVAEGVPVQRHKSKTSNYAEFPRPPNPIFSFSYRNLPIRFDSSRPLYLHGLVIIPTTFYARHRNVQKA